MFLRFKTVVLVLVVFLTVNARGSLVLDQSYVPPVVGLSTHAFHHASDAKYNEMAETFTVGLNGTLSEVDLLLHEQVQSQDLAVRIVQTNPDGTPRPDAEAVLAAEVVPATTFPTVSTFIPVQLPDNGLLNVTDGEVLAIEVSVAEYEDFTGVTGDWWDGEVSSTKQLPYAGGQAFEKGTLTSDQWDPILGSIVPNPSALGFETYVTSAPEPGASGILLISAIIVLIRRRRTPLKMESQ